MAAPIITLRDSADVELVPPIIFPGVLPGSPSAPIEIRAYNDFDAGGTDTAERLFFRASARNKGDDQFVSSGHPALDAYALQMRIIGSTTNVTAPLTAYLGVGPDQPFDLPDLPSPTGGVFTEVRIALPASSPPAVVEFALELERLLTVFVGKQVLNGIVAGLGDSASLYVVSKDGAVVPDSPESNFVDFPSIFYVVRGLAREPLQGLIEFDEFDGASAALDPGEGYISLVSLGLGGLTVTKGLKDTLGLDVTNRPEVPIGELAWTYVEKHEGLPIDPPKITDVAVPALFFGIDSGLVLTIGGGTAHSGGFRVRKTTPTAVGLAPNATNDVFLTGNDGSFVVTDGVDANRPDGDPVHLWRAVTDGATVTTLEDRRGAGVEVRGR